MVNSTLLLKYTYNQLSIPRKLQLVLFKKLKRQLNNPDEYCLIWLKALCHKGQTSWMFSIQIL